MTPDEIETAAIEAAAEEMARPWQAYWASVEGVICNMTGNVVEHAGDFRKNVSIAEKMNKIDRAQRAIRAYERAMWRPIGGVPLDGTSVLGETSDGDFYVSRWYGTPSYTTTFTHFRPLPRREGE